MIPNIRKSIKWVVGQCHAKLHVTAEVFDHSLAKGFVARLKICAYLLNVPYVTGAHRAAFHDETESKRWVHRHPPVRQPDLRDNVSVALCLVPDEYQPRGYADDLRHRAEHARLLVTPAVAGFQQRLLARIAVGGECFSGSFLTVARPWNLGVDETGNCIGLAQRIPGAAGDARRR